LLSTYDLQLRCPVNITTANPFFKTCPMSMAMKATSSVPGIFPPVETIFVPEGQTDEVAYNLIDGGVFAVNPALCTHIEIMREYRSRGLDVPPMFHVSLGTGNSSKPYPYEETKDWGLLKWLSPLQDIVIDGLGDTINFQMEELYRLWREDVYSRFQLEIPYENSNMADASDKNIQALQDLGNAFTQDPETSEKIDKACERLLLE
jgi:uncharacterized protein